MITVSSEHKWGWNKLVKFRMALRCSYETYYLPHDPPAKWNMNWLTVEIFQSIDLFIDFCIRASGLDDCILNQVIVCP